MTRETDAWNSFLRSGSVLDYLEYKAIQRARHGLEEPEDKDEILDQGTDTPPTEYR